MRVDEWCQRIMSIYLRICFQAIQSRQKQNYTSYETEVYFFLHSDEFKQVSKQSLPLRLAKNEPECVVLAMCLDRLFATLARESLTASRVEKNPELFKKEAVDELTPAEQNSEVNRFLGWAIFSSKDHLDESSYEKNP